ILSFTTIPLSYPPQRGGGGCQGIGGACYLSAAGAKKNSRILQGTLFFKKCNCIWDFWVILRDIRERIYNGGFFERTPGSRYLIKEGRETPQEIEQSKKSPGAGMEVAKNRMGGVYAWLLYDFAVGGANLKSGHKSYLTKINDEIKAYGKLNSKTGTILVSGFASPSGVHQQNVDLSKKRAHSVVEALSRNGVSRVWCHIKESKSSDIYTVVKGTPNTPRDRSLCRGVYIVLWLMRDLPVTDKFSDALRKHARTQILGRFTQYEKLFYYWVIDNWKYLVKPTNNYVRKAMPFEDGLFFYEPQVALTNDREVWTYLRALHGEFKNAAHRLKHQYTGVPGHSGLPAGGNPVRCYQQLARWICLDGHARAGSEHVFHFMPGKSIQDAMNELIEMINSGRKFGNPQAVWSKIEQYMKQKRIPMKVVKKPVR
ncbi:MAG: OmpA family protein, partial [Desulfotignum sp.]|nr:OmpA family protein [Desulfotignum sp.]